ncbi:MAG: hypothetical protein Kow0020_05950 [Wenzhouxiangellaceae bacterium]
MIKIRAIILATFAVALHTSVHAQVGAENLKCGEVREVQGGLLSESTYKRLNSAFEKLGEEQYREALEDLRKLYKSRLSDYEKASVAQAIGYAEAQLENYPEAIRYFEEAIRLNQLPNSSHFQMILQVAQLYNAMKRYDDALRQLDYWFCVTDAEAKQQAEVWIFKASLHVQKEEWQKALEAVDQAIALRPDAPESWYQLKLGMHLQMRQFPQAIETLKILIGMNPGKKEYWLQLAGSYLELNQKQEAMATLRLAHRRGLLDKSAEYLQLAGLLQDLDSPRQAAEVLEEGLNKGIVANTVSNWEALAGAWFQARELDKALEAYERAGALSDNGKIDFQRASIFAAKEDWEGVIESTARALEKGGLTESQLGNAWLLAGMAKFYLGDLDAAERDFKQAEKYGKIRKAAAEWLNHIRDTRQRLAQR